MAFINTTTLRTKLISGFLVGVILIGGVSMFALTRMRGAREKMTEATKSLEIAQTLEIQSRILFSLAIDFALVDNPLQLEVLKPQIAFATYTVQNSLDALLARGTIDLYLLDTINDRITGSFQTSQNIIHIHDLRIASVLGGEQARLQAQEQAELNALQNTQEEVSSAVIRVIEEANENFDQAVIGAKRVEQTTQITLLVASLGALAFGLSFSQFISRPIKQLTKTALQISKGDLSQRVSVTSKDEIGELAVAFNQMTKGLLEARQLPENILRSIRDSLFVVNTSGIITEINEAAVNTLGYTKKELVGKPISIVISGDRQKKDKDQKSAI